MINSTETLVPSSNTVVPLAVQTVGTRRPETRMSDVGKDSATWTWENLRDYVVRQIEEKHGPFPRDAIREKATFSGFVNRWGAMSGLIAETAFDVFDGRWKGAPISVNRFCKGSDEFFAKEIVARLTS